MLCVYLAWVQKARDSDMAILILGDHGRVDCFQRRSDKRYCL